jgi:hypothetical protein
MDIEVVRNTLLCCAVINYGLLMFWFLLYALARTGLQRLWGRWFRLTTEQFDAINFAGMALYKVGILLLCLVPYVALSTVR